MSYSALIGINQPPFIFGYDHNGTGADFYLFLVLSIQNGALNDGDILIVDNAAVHVSSDYLFRIKLIMHVWNIKLIFLPSYSPELNPIELVFAQVKKHLRTYRTGVNSLKEDIAAAFRSVSNNNIKSYYEHCINKWNLD